MKLLDDYISKNLEQFDNEEPLHGHIDRFDAKLAQLGKRKGNQIYISLLKIAAAVLLGMVISYAAIREFKLLNRTAAYTISAAAYPELNEAEKFYTSQLSQYYNVIQDMGFNNDQKEKRRVMDELTEMDIQVRAMKQDLQQNPDDERIVNAIINFYQVKIELMDMIITRTQRSNYTIL
jgi:hypothetical protein